MLTTDSLQFSIRPTARHVLINCPKCAREYSWPEDNSGFQSCQNCGYRFHFTTRPDPRLELVIGSAIIVLWILLVLALREEGVAAGSLLGCSVFAFVGLWLARIGLKRKAASLRSNGSARRLPGTKLIDDLLLAFGAVIAGSLMVLVIDLYLQGMADRPETSIAQLEHFRLRLEAATKTISRISSVMLWASILAGVALLWLRRHKLWDRLESGRKKLAKGLKFVSMVGLCMTSFAAAGFAAADPDQRALVRNLGLQLDTAREAHVAVHRRALQAIGQLAADEALSRLEAMQPRCGQDSGAGSCDPLPGLNEVVERIEALRGIYSIQDSPSWIGPDLTGAPSPRMVEEANRHLLDLMGGLEAAQATTAAVPSYDVSAVGVLRFSYAPVASRGENLDEAKSLRRLVGLLVSTAAEGLPFGLSADADPVLGALLRSFANRIPGSFKARLEELATDLVVETARSCAREWQSCDLAPESLERARRDPRLAAAASDVVEAVIEGAPAIRHQVEAAADTIEPAEERYRALALGCRSGGLGTPAGACQELAANEAKLQDEEYQSWADRLDDRNRETRQTNVTTPATRPFRVRAGRR